MAGLPSSKAVLLVGGLDTGYAEIEGLMVEGSLWIWRSGGFLFKILADDPVRNDWMAGRNRMDRKPAW
jgi:hypothetical protein